MTYLRVTLMISVFLSFRVLTPPAWAQEKIESVILSGEAGIEVFFEMRDSTWRWVRYRDAETGRSWDIGGPCFSLQTPDKRRTSLGERGFARLAR